MPYNNTRLYTVKLDVMMTDEARIRAKRAARREGMSFSEFVRYAIRKETMLSEDYERRQEPTDAYTKMETA